MPKVPLFCNDATCVPLVHRNEFPGIDQLEAAARQNTHRTEAGASCVTLFKKKSLPLGLASETTEVGKPRRQRYVAQCNGQFPSSPRIVAIVTGFG